MISLSRIVLAATAASAVILPNISTDKPVELGVDKAVQTQEATTADVPTAPVDRPLQRGFDRAPQEKVYTPQDAEYYLTAEQIGFVQPGYNVEIVSIEITEDRIPMITLEITDNRGNLLDLEDPNLGDFDLRFILSKWRPEYEGGEYIDYFTRSNGQATYDRGEREMVGPGVYEYTLEQLDADIYDPDATHTLAIFGSREVVIEFIDFEKEYLVNMTHDFVPNGSEIESTWARFDDDDCNKCHGNLTAHGIRQGVKLCATCHYDGVIDPDTGNSVDMEIMIHKIHMGANLPSVEAGEPYQIIGYRGSVHDYSEVHFPHSVMSCDTCHTPDSPQGDIWMTQPTAEGCFSCHDDIDMETMAGHPGGFFPEELCSTCHTAVSPYEYDASIVGAHTIPTESDQLEGLNMEILEVTNTDPGDQMVITFRVTDDEGNLIDPTTLDRFSWLVGGPSVEITDYFRESLNADNLTMSGDAWMYTMETPLPGDIEGTWVVSADLYRFVTIDNFTDEGIRVREAAFNPIHYVGVTDAEPVERRQIVALDKCNECHDVLALHGGQRFALEECVLCHNPTVTDEEVRVEGAGEPVSVSFAYMIHRIHAGETLENDFIVYGHRSSVHDYSDVVYPNDLSDCQVCHLPETYELPLPEAAHPVTAPSEPFSPLGPATAACVGCHDSQATLVHAYVNTADFGEACAVCHGPGDEAGVEMVHAD